MTAPSPAFLDALDKYGTRAREAALAHLPAGVTEYLTVPAAAYLERGGKGLRPALCLATCEAFGGTLEAALPSAAALELFHTAFLVHDDIEDDSELRRGAATLHRLYGAPLAINAGDGLVFFALSALRPNVRLLGPRLAARVLDEFELMARHTVEGQALELGWRRDGRMDLTADDYLDLIMKKTCWYTTILPLRVGALIGGHRSGLEAMVRFGFFLGAAFQIRDDILNLIGDPERYGKELLGDLREGKRTLILLHLLAACTQSERDWLQRYMEAPGESVVQQLREMMEHHGSISFAEEFGRGIAGMASGAFEHAFADAPDSDARRFVGDLVSYMISRDR